MNNLELAAKLSAFYDTIEELFGSANEKTGPSTRELEFAKIIGLAQGGLASAEIDARYLDVKVMRPEKEVAA